MIPKLKVISGVIFTILLWHIGFWDKNNVPYPFTLINLSEKFYQDWLVLHKLEIGITAGAIVLLIQLLSLRNPFKEKKKRILNDINKHYINNKFRGENEINRITIFKAKRGYEIYPLFFSKCIFGNWKEHKQRDLLKFYFRKKFPRPFRQYLVQHSRNGHPYPNGSSSFFLVPENDKEVSSLAAESFFKEKPKKAILPKLDADAIRRTKKIDNLKGRNKCDTRLYMKESKVNSFEMLKCFHRFPTRLYAEPIFLEDGRKWGCIVFDSEDEIVDDSHNSFEDFVNYNRMVQSIVSNLSN